MCSIIVYLNCSSLDQPRFKLEIKMIWNWLLSLFTNENLFSIGFELLKDMNEINQDYVSPGHLEHLERLEHLEHLEYLERSNAECSNQRNASCNRSCNSNCLPSDSQCINNSPFIKRCNHSFNCNQLPSMYSKCEEQAKLSKLNSISLPDLIPEEERKQLALKEIGAKLRHISESFERNLKKT